VNFGERDKLQKGSEISEVGEILIFPVDGERRVASSKVFKITTLGSSSTQSGLAVIVGLLVALLHSLGFDLGFSIVSSAYSGREEKLSGVITTWYVPGLNASAFFSRSSSEVSMEKGGSESPREK
jgi:hypothetical protein